MLSFRAAEAQNEATGERNHWEIRDGTEINDPITNDQALGLVTGKHVSSCLTAASMQLQPKRD